MIDEQTETRSLNDERSVLRNTRGHHYHAIQIVLSTGMVLSTLCLIIRFYVKRRLCKEFAIEDFSLTMAWGLFVVTQTVILYALGHAGLGIHFWNLTQKTIEMYEKLLIAAACQFVAGLCLARLTHLIFFHRLMAAKKWLRYTLFAVAALIIIGSSVIICSFVFACQPVSKAWNISLSGRCIDQSGIFVALAALSIVSDICLILLPIPIILDLHISRTQKFRFMITLLLVCSTFIASAIRLWLTVPLLGCNDLTYGMAPVAILVGVESNFIIIAACFPAIKQFFGLVTAANSPMHCQAITNSQQTGRNTLENERRRSDWRTSNVLGEEFSPSPASSWAREVVNSIGGGGGI